MRSLIESRVAVESMCRSECGGGDHRLRDRCTSSQVSSYHPGMSRLLVSILDRWMSRSGHSTRMTTNRLPSARADWWQRSISAILATPSSTTDRPRRSSARASVPSTDHPTGPCPGGVIPSRAACTAGYGRRPLIAQSWLNSDAFNRSAASPATVDLPLPGRPVTSASTGQLVADGSVISGADPDIPQQCPRQGAHRVEREVVRIEPLDVGRLVAVGSRRT